MPTDPRIAVLSALSSPGWHPVPEAHGMPWDEAEQLLAAYDASRAAAPAAVPSAPADRAAILREAADTVDAMNEGCSRRQPCGACNAREDATDSLRRMADEAQPADGYQLDEEYAIDVDEDGRPFARVLFAFLLSVPGEKRIALVHGITEAVDGARFGAEAVEAPAPLRRAWDDCPGFPEKCPNLRPVDPDPPTHLGGIRCGCADKESTS
ncbi:hypothetical protein ACFC01_17945 [Streptomyces mirabilis]|uniref:hypothetical protein n=1 Tax=Streptomyces mirabilis TaxID=68239 RepID=UPI0035D8EDD0